MAKNFGLNVVSLVLTISLFFETKISRSAAENHFVYDEGRIHQEQEQQPEKEQMATGALERRRFLLYEVNHSEGFNLRRDVYMRMANLVLKLVEVDEGWVLVLPPWGHLYHWKSEELGRQSSIPWAHFFQLDSLNKHVPVIEFHQYLKERESIDMVYYLQYFANTFEESNEWTEKYEETTCLDTPMYQSNEKQKVKGWFWGYDHVFANNFSCLSLQGQASTVIPLLMSRNESSIMFDRAETMLHDSFGDEAYWKARRSMRFAKKLMAIGDEFRQKFLNSTDLTDGTKLTEDWRDSKADRKRAKGGPYLGIHLRRADFLQGRAKHLPSLAKAAEKIKSLLKMLNLTLVYVATDAPQKEFLQLESHLMNWAKCLRFSPKINEKKQLGDGGVAIVDQWIVSHARYFIGSHESTFTFRIQEEREIFGFHPDSTFNRFCGDEEKPCEAPSRWTIVY